MYEAASWGAKEDTRAPLIEGRIEPFAMGAESCV